MGAINIHKAQDVYGFDNVEAATIHIDQTIPDFKELINQDIFCEREAEWLEETLLNSLPGATDDRLLSLMLTRKASHFRVPHVVKGGA